MIYVDDFAKLVQTSAIKVSLNLVSFGEVRNKLKTNEPAILLNSVEFQRSAMATHIMQDDKFRKC